MTKPALPHDGDRCWPGTCDCSCSTCGDGRRDGSHPEHVVSLCGSDPRVCVCRCRTCRTHTTEALRAPAMRPARTAR